MSQVNKLAMDPRNGWRPTYFYTTGRAAMLDLLANTGGLVERGVLLPAFIGWSPREGSGVFDPIKSLGLNFGFYNLQDDLRLDLHDLERQMRSGNYRVVVVIHYFGRSEQLARVRELADSLDMLLVEDLAHGFLTAAVGRSADLWGDASLYSLHKLLPISQGGIAQYRDDSLVAGQASTMPGLAHTLLSYDWQAIAVRRRSNFMLLTERLIRLGSYGEGFALLWPDLDDKDVPQTLPVAITGPGRDGLYASMNSQGVGMVSLYHTLIPEISDGYQNVKDLSRRIINFPVHQDVTSDDVIRVVDVFECAVEAL